MVNIKTATIRWKSCVAYLTSKLVAMFRQSTLPCPRTLIIDNFTPLPPRTYVALDIFRPPETIAFMRAKWAINVSMFKFIRLTKNSFIALSALDYFARSCLQSARCTTIFTWFLACNIGENRECMSAIFTGLHNFRLPRGICHGTIIRYATAMSSKMPDMGDSRGKR